MIDFNDSTDSVTAARRDMVEQQIRARGIRNPDVLAAMGSVRRELFVPAEFQHLAYEDRALPIGEDQTISQPYIVAYMTAALRVGTNDKVLEVGTGSGYQLAILAQLTSRIHTVERLESLAGSAAESLARLKVRGVTFHVGDGSLGWPPDAPYDRIIVTAAAPSVPHRLVDQLVDDGRMVIPVGNTDRQTLVTVVKSRGRTVEHPTIPCRFVKLIGQDAWS